MTSALHMELKGKYELEDYGDDFDGVFRFTNATSEDFIFLWNNKEYIYPAGKTVPMIIADESLERIQSIRKMAAKRLAEREYFKTKEFMKAKNGLKDSMAGRFVIASSYDEKLLQPWVDECLKPLEIGRATIRNVPEEQLNVIAKAIGSGNKENPFPPIDLNAEFKESNEELLAKSRS